MTLGDLFADWYERHGSTLARAPTDESTWRTHIRDGIGRQRLSLIKRADIGRVRDRVAKDGGPIASNTALILINRVLNWGVDEGLIEFNPAARLRKVGEVKPRERVISDEDIPKLWNALSAMDTLTMKGMPRDDKDRMLSPATRSTIRLLLLTAQRRGEVAEAQKSELQLDGDEPVWTIPGARTKNGLMHRVPLCPMAREEFSKAVAAAPKSSRYVFPSPIATGDTPILASAVTRAMSRLIKDLGLPPLSPHDLRRTVGTQLARIGLPTHVRSLVLNHSAMSRSITDAVYNRYSYDKEKREALMAWEARLSQLLADKQTDPAVPASEAA